MAPHRSTFVMPHRWTDEDFEILRRLHVEGKSFAEIARMIGSTPMSCARHASQLGITRTRTGCVVCGKSLPSQKGKPGRKRQYCGRACQAVVKRAYVRNDAIDNRRYTRCLNCGTVLSRSSQRTKWCSKECDQRGWYESSKYDLPHGWRYSGNTYRSRLTTLPESAILRSNRLPREPHDPA